MISRWKQWTRERWLKFQRCMPCSFLVLGLHAKKLSFTTHHLRSRWLGNRLKRPVFGEFSMVRPKQHLRSLTNRSVDSVVPPQLPSRRWFMFCSCWLPATGTCRFSHPRITRGRARALVASCLVRDHSQREMNCSLPQLKRVHEIAYPYAESLGNPPRRMKAHAGLFSAIANLSKGLICLLKHLPRTAYVVSGRLISRAEVILEIFSQFFERFVLVPASYIVKKQFMTISLNIKKGSL